MKTGPNRQYLHVHYFTEWMFSLNCILNILKLTYLSKRLTSDVVSRDCRSFCTPRSRSFCCRSTAPSSVLHTRLDTQYVAAICNLTLSFIIYCISLFSKLSSPITNSLAVEPLAMLAITHRACGSKGTSNTVQSPGGYFRNLWVGLSRWNPGTLNLYQS